MNILFYVIGIIVAIANIIVYAAMRAGGMDDERAGRK